MFTVGVIGPHPSVKRILDVAKEFEDEMSFQPFTYKSAHETAQIVRDYHQHVDAWLFSGPIPYAIAKAELDDHESLFGIFFLESGFYQSFLNLLYQKGRLLEKISIDIPDDADVANEALQQLNMKPDDVYIKKFEAHIDYMELYQFHKALWVDGKIDGVLTCYPQVQELLEKDGIAAQWISTTRLETYQTLQILAEKARTSYFKSTQIAVCIVETLGLEIDIQADSLSFDMQYTDLKMNEELLFLSRELNGSFLKIGDGSYIIFSSRGELEHKIQVLQHTIQKLTRAWNRTVLAGIGFGDSALTAELNARRAVQHSKQDKTEKIIIIDNQGKIVEYINEKENLSYSSASNDEKLVKKLQAHHISVQTFEKVKACVERKRWKEFTTKDLALQLNMSDRNAQRIISSLCKAGVVKNIGEERKQSKGRPNKLYTLSHY